MPIEPKSERDKILNIKSSPPLAETVGLLRGALRVCVFLPIARQAKLSESYRPVQSPGHLGNAV